MRLWWFFVATLLACGLAPALRAQNTTAASALQPIAQLPSFDVASVKPADRSGPVELGLENEPGGRIQGGGSLKIFILYAFDLQFFQISGGPPWMDHDLYVINAIPPEGSAARQSKPSSTRMPFSLEQRQMLQALLIDRFGLKYHMETRQGRVYWLERSNKQLKLTPTKDAKSGPYVVAQITNTGEGNGELLGENASMALMAQRLSSYLKMPVFDKTGIQGTFDFDVQPPEPVNSDITDSILLGVGTLGLKLKAATGPGQYLVVDDAKPPTAN
jgi:uncharacterized protein (TIGR03435 family)